MLLASSLLPWPALAGDQEPVFFGGQATLTAGALSAYTEEADAIWYNPACLAAIRRDRVSLSGSNFALRIRERPAVLQALTDEGLASAADRHTSLGFIPIGMGFARSLSERATFGFGFYLRERDLFETEATLRLDPASFAAPPELDVASFGLEHQRWKMDVGLALGWQVGPRVRLGVALYGNLLIESTEATVLHQRDEAEWSGPVATGAHVDLQLKSFALEGYAIFGLQLRLAEGWYLGLVYRTAEAALWRRDDVSSTRALEALRPVFGEATSRRALGERSGSRLLDEVGPPILRLALSYRARRGWLALEGEVGPPLRDPAAGVAEQLLWNVRIGGTFSINERLAVGGGFFTANGDLAVPDGVVNPAVDYYGVTMGMTFRRAHQVRGRREPLIFSTTMAARYALAVGESVGLRFDPSDLERGYEQGSSSDVMFYDLSWYFGTAILL